MGRTAVRRPRWWNTVAAQNRALQGTAACRFRPAAGSDRRPQTRWSAAACLCQHPRIRAGPWHGTLGALRRPFGLPPPASRPPQGGVPRLSFTSGTHRSGRAGAPPPSRVDPPSASAAPRPAYPRESARGELTCRCSSAYRRPGVPVRCGSRPGGPGSGRLLGLRHLPLRRWRSRIQLPCWASTTTASNWWRDRTPHR